MSTSSPPNTSRRVQFEVGVTNSPRRGVKVSHQSTNEDLYHRMVATEMKMWNDADIKPQIEADVLDQTFENSKRHVKFEKVVRSPSDGSINVVHKSTGKQYYHRMVDIETKIWNEANIKAKSEPEVLDRGVQIVQLRVKFVDSVTDSHCDVIKVPKSTIKKEYYDRMVKLEAAIWREGNNNEEHEPGDWSGGNSTVSTEYDDELDYEVVRGEEGLGITGVIMNEGSYVLVGKRALEEESSFD